MLFFISFSMLSLFFYWKSSQLNLFSQHASLNQEEKDSPPSLKFSQQALERLCNETNEIVLAVRNHVLSNETEALNWKQTGPFHLLTCEQMIRALPISLLTNTNVNVNDTTESTTIERNGNAHIDDTQIWELENSISLQRLARKLLKLETKQDDETQTHPLTIVVAGGSVSTGLSDRNEKYKDFFNVAYARKLEQLMQHNCPN